MNKTDFLNTLKRKLQEELDEAQVNEHWNYYEQYISQEVQTGKSEEAVIDSLGDPLLLARTILETSGDSASGSVKEHLYTNANSAKRAFRKVDFTSGWGCVAAVIVTVLIACIILWLVGVIVGTILPVLIPVIIVLFIVSLIRNRK